MKYLALLTLLTFSTINAQSSNVTQLFNVQTVQVKESSHAKSMKSFGYVRVDDSRVFDVTPRFGGFVEKLYANKLYKKVHKGEALVEVYSPEVLQAKDEYINSLRYSKNQSMINSSMKKLQLLNIPNNEIKSLKKDKNFTTIIAPSDGYIFKKFVNNNTAFRAKEVMFEIVNLDTVWVEVNIHQDQLQRLQNIDTFTLSTPALEQTFQAKNYHIYPVLDEKEESFTLRLEIKNPQTLLKPGMYMKVLMNQIKKTYLTLPSTAVIRKNGTFYVFVVGEYEGEYDPLEIEVEVLNPDTYIVKSGLLAGEKVVNNALFMMDSDAQINGLY